MNEKFNDCLNDCLDMLLAGESISCCLKKFPENREELRPLLEMAQLTVAVTTNTTSNPKAKSLGLIKLTSTPPPAWSQGRWFKGLGWQFKAPRKVFAGIIATVVIVGSIVGTDVASANSVPGEALYWVKVQREHISLILPQSDISKAEIHARLATTRFNEMSRLSGLGRFDEAQEAAKRIRFHLGETAGFVGVYTAVDRIEMPIKRVRFGHPLETTRLKNSLRLDRRALISNFAMPAADMEPDNRNRFETLMHRSNIDYYTLIVALEGRPISLPRPFWRVESGGFQEE